MAVQYIRTAKYTCDMCLADMGAEIHRVSPDIRLKVSFESISGPRIHHEINEVCAQCAPALRTLFIPVYERIEAQAAPVEGPSHD